MRIAALLLALLLAFPAFGQMGRVTIEVLDFPPSPNQASNITDYASPITGLVTTPPVPGNGTQTETIVPEKMQTAETNPIVEAISGFFIWLASLFR